MAQRIKRHGLLLLLFITNLSAQIRPEVVAVRTDQLIEIDGSLDEDVWRSIVPVTEFVQRLPQDGAQPSEKSEMRILYNDNYLYFGFTFFDSDPEKVLSLIHI